MNSENKVLIVGLDGATFDLILPWVKSGKLPFLHDMMEKGVYGDLISTIPVLTPPAWSSFMTGKNPGKHGIVGFFTRETGGYNLEIVNSTHRPRRELWTILSKDGKKVGIINVPFTYPPKKVNGFMITGMMTPPRSNNFTYPIILKEDVKKVMSEGTLDPFFTYLEGERVFINKLFDSTDKLANVSSFLINTHAFDFFMVVFNGTDYIQHRFWGRIDPNHPNYQAKEAEKYQKLILRYYQRIDKIISKLFSLVDKKTTVIVLSDHGAGPMQKYININSWFLKTNFLVMKKGLKTRLKRFLYKNGVNPEKIYNALLRVHFGNLGIKGDRTDRRLPLILKQLFLSFSDIDWKKSKAFSSGSGLIYLNLKGRELLGAVSPGEEYETLRDALINLLYQLKDPETGKHIIEKVYKKEEIYFGPYLDTLPDIVFVPKQGYMIFEGYEFGANSTITDAKAISAAHRPNGILLMKGPKIKRNVRLRNADLMDITPTVLHLLRSSIPEDMDGKVLVDALNPSYLSSNPVRCNEKNPASLMPSDAPEKNVSPYSREEEEQLKLRLKNLGYIT